MDIKKVKKLGLSLTYWLRHNPEAIGVEIQKNGWVDVDDVIENSEFTLDELKWVVSKNDKKRFSFNDDFTKIRANQGHSVDIEFEFDEVLPPKYLYHGTKKENVKNILKNGIDKMRRHHVHLSKDIETATKVAERRKGDVVILRILALKMRADRYKIYISENGVYLTDYVPPEYITVLG